MLKWQGKGLEEYATDQMGEVRVRVNQKYYRPCEVDLLLGDASKAKRVLGWEPKIKFEEMIIKMVEEYNPEN